MTNKELRDRGELYDANYDPELVRLMDECKDKCWEYNQIKPSDWAAKDAKLREIIGSVASLYFWKVSGGAIPGLTDPGAKFNNAKMLKD